MDIANGEISFSFGNGGVGPQDLYTPEKGFGWVTEENRMRFEVLQIPELSSGFREMPFFQGQTLTRIKKNEVCCLDVAEASASSGDLTGEDFPGEKRHIPLTFRADVQEPGNYIVLLVARSTVKRGDKLLIFGSNRQLLVLDDTSTGQLTGYGAALHLCDIIPRGKETPFSSRGIEITLVGEGSGFMELQILRGDPQTPVIYLAGDSTVTNQSADYPYAPGTSYGSWGQMLTPFLSDALFISNHAHSGLTTESFRSEGHYDILYQDAKPGDYVFFQFGHNDQKLPHLTARGGYRNNLLTYISECRSKGLHPVLVTPLARNSWKGSEGSYNDLLAEYSDACLEIGKETHVPVLDLHKLSMDLIQELGLEGAKKYFYPDDFTHTNDYGAYKMAGLVVAQIRGLAQHEDEAYRILADCFTPPQDEQGILTQWSDPVWEPTTKIILPRKPKCMTNIPDPEETTLFQDIADPDTVLNRVSALDLVIQTGKFFPTNVYNDLFPDVLGHEWYAGTVECGIQNGLISEVLTPDGCFYPLQSATLEEFLSMLTRCIKSRYSVMTLASCVYDSLCQYEIREDIRTAYALGLLDPKGKSVLTDKLTKGEAATLCKKALAAVSSD
jgi:lysophospholipase L1-like esterase